MEVEREEKMLLEMLMREDWLVLVFERMCKIGGREIDDDILELNVDVGENGVLLSGREGR